MYDKILNLNKCSKKNTNNITRISPDKKGIILLNAMKEL